MEALIHLNIGFTKTCFRTSGDGRVTFHPWAYAGPGYPLERPEVEAEMRRKIGIMNALALFVLFPVVLVLSFVVGPQICLVLLVLAMVGVWQYTRSLAKELQINDRQ
jgi:hypothetical protein